MKCVIVLGASGMAGHLISMYLKETHQYQVIDICHYIKLDENSILMDANNVNHLTEFIEQKKPDIIINCIGILNRTSNITIPEYIAINSYFPRYLEYYFRDKKTKIVHLSTDCVFSGRIGGYTENVFPDGQDIYARSKALGEVVNDKDITIRTSIIGPELKKNGIGLFHWFMMQKGEVQGYTNVYWTGITTLELAGCIGKIIEKNITGLYHLVPDKAISKYDLLNIVKDVFEKDVQIQKRHDIVCDKSLVDTRKELNYDIPTYENMISDLKEWMALHEGIYGNIYNINRNTSYPRSK